MSNFRKAGYTTTPERSKIMSRIRGRNTLPEKLLRKHLWSLGVRYWINFKRLPGSPDIVVRKHKIAVFIDGEFWHGHEWHLRKEKIKTNRGYWIPKIENNMARDTDNNEKLAYMGFKVIRFWAKDVLQNPAICVKRILDLIEDPDDVGYGWGD